MAQTGVPFGEVAAVTTWLGIQATIGRPNPEHPKRPIEGLECARSEVSGKRLWGLFADRYADADTFFNEHFVANYCPLVFMDESARNVTPDKLPVAARQPLEAACDAHLAKLIKALAPEWLIGVGAWAEGCGKRVVEQFDIPNVQLGRILHPSPASPAANKGWASTATRQLTELGVW
jgi:single-strand selective monofunctional uracil DNA glycosylase